MVAEKREMLSILIIAALVLFPVPFYGQEQPGEMPANAPPPTLLTNQMAANFPPVAQPLVPEGTFAVQLVEALKTGQAQNEAQAENMLSAKGIEPKNGWIAEYPVTPDIVGQIEKSVAAAADARKLEMGKDQAQKAVENLLTRLGLNVTPDPSSPSVQASSSGRTGNATIYKYTDENGVSHYTDRYESIPRQYRDQLETIQEEAPPRVSVGPSEEWTESQVNNFAAYPSPEVINNYYYNDGPAVVTYYAPPAPYYYLYAWVPYPFRYYGFYFPGFFILRDFHRHIFFNRQVFVISNHVVSAAHRTVSIVDPVTKAHGGKNAVHPAGSPRVITSPSARAGAQAIFALSHRTANPGKVATGPGLKKAATPSSSTRMQGPTRPGQGANITTTTPSTINRGSTPHPAGMGMTALRPSTARRQNGMTFQRPAAAQPRAFSPPAPSGRYFSQAPQAQVARPAVVPQHGGFSSALSSGVRGSFKRF